MFITDDISHKWITRLILGFILKLCISLYSMSTCIFGNMTACVPSFLLTKRSGVQTWLVNAEIRGEVVTCHKGGWRSGIQFIIGTHLTLQPLQIHSFIRSSLMFCSFVQSSQTTEVSQWWGLNSSMSLYQVTENVGPKHLVLKGYKMRIGKAPRILNFGK